MTTAASAAQQVGDSAIVAVEAASVGPDAWARSAAAPGLAAVGRVVDGGPGAAHLLGQRVLAGRFAPCGECDVCRRGGAVVCPTGEALGARRGALGDGHGRLAAPARWLIPLEGPLAVAGASAAVLGWEAALAYALYARAGVGPREPVVVIGDDAVAALLRQILAAKHASVLDLAAATPEHDNDDADDVRARLVAAAAAAGHGARPWKVLETTGEAALRARALAIAGPRVVVALAAPPGAAPVTDAAATSAALAREVTIVGVAGAHPDLLTEVAALAVRGELDPVGAAELVPHEHLAAAWSRRATTRPSTALVATFAP
jgi:D-arabinose 1-dehydrogenase-like Zn-dependent alcohol dehydrogenase